MCPKAPANIDGQPWCNSHYTRQLWVWSTVMSLSRQHWDATCQDRGHQGASGDAGCLTLVSIAGAPERLPVFIKNAILHWERDAGRLLVAAGTMRAQRVIVQKDVDEARSSRLVLSDCTGPWEIPEGGALLLLDVCRIEYTHQESSSVVDQ